MVFFTGPLPFELLAGLFRVFGAEIAVGRVFMVGVQAAATGVAFAFARRAGAGAFAHAAAAVVAASPLLLFPLLTVFYYTPLALQPGRLRGLRRPARHHGASLGGRRGRALRRGGAVQADARRDARRRRCSARWSPPARAARALRRLLAFAGGGAAVAAVTLLAFAARGDLAALVRWLVVVPLSLQSQFNSPLINFWPPGELAPELAGNKALYLPSHWFQLYGILTRVTPWMVLSTQLLYALPFVALAATWLARLARPLPAAVWMNGAVLFALTANLFPRADWGHLVYALPPACVQLCLLAGRIGATRPTRPRGVTIAAAACVAALLASGAGFSRLAEACLGEPELRAARSAAAGERGLSLALAPERDPVPAPARQAGRADLRRARRALDLFRDRHDESDALHRRPHEPPARSRRPPSWPRCRARASW